MNRYQLAKVVEWAGTLESRKRMQKVIYLLQTAGCPLEAEYTLHHYGPYSQDVARLTDEMVRTNLLVEAAESNGVGTQYSYTLSKPARDSLADFETTPHGRAQAAEMDGFLSKNRWLLETDLRDLEYAATAVFFRVQGHDWPTAVDKMLQFKSLTNAGQVVERADALARRVIA